MENQDPINHTENTEDLQVNPEIPAVMQVTEDMRSYLYDAARWTRFLAVFGMIAAVFSVLIGLSASSILSRPEFQSSGVYSNMAPQTLLYMFFIYAVIMFIMSYLLFRFSQKTLVGILYMHPNSLSEGLKNLKNFFRFQGILVIVLLSIYLLSIIAVLTKM